MTMQGKIGRPGGQKTKRALGVQAALYIVVEIANRDAGHCALRISPE